MARGGIFMYFVITFCLLEFVHSWDNDDLEVFDVVEEVNQNFYDLLGVTQEASPQEIKSAFKRLTLKLHPDKSDAPDADIQFRNLVSVHNVLKDPVKREKYNEVLRNGLPNWRSAVYYYRHVRKMGLAEGTFILFIIITLGQYAVAWAAYVEKKYTAEQILNSRTKRQQKKNTLGMEVAEILEQFPKPSVKDTLPFQIPKLIFYSIIGIPGSIVAIHQHFKHQREEKLRQIKREEEERMRQEREAAEAEAARAARAAAGPRRRRGFVPEEREGGPDVHLEAHAQDNNKTQQAAPPVISGGLWTDDDLAELVRLVKKYPPGAPERWERVATAMNRTVHEVTHMAAKLKDNCYRLPGQEEVQETSPEQPKKTKTRKNESESSGAACSWSQAQQRALESALAKFPKSGASDRWDKIAKCVPDKTKEECMLRCKYLADMVRKQKQKEEESNQNENNRIIENSSVVENNGVNSPTIDNEENT